MPGASVGSVSVAVVPSAEGWNAALRDQLLPQADELGEEIGERIRAGVEAALADTRFDVLADAEEASATIAGLQAQIDELKATSDIDVGADTAGADAGVDGLGSRIRRTKTDADELGAAIEGAGLTSDEAFLAGRAALDAYRDSLAEVAAELAAFDTEAAVASGELVALGASSAEATTGLEGIAAAEAQVEFASLGMGAAIAVGVLALAPVAAGAIAVVAGVGSAAVLALPDVKELIDTLEGKPGGAKSGPVAEAAAEIRGLESDLKNLAVSSGVGPELLGDLPEALQSAENILTAIEPLAHAGAGAISEILSAIDRVTGSGGFSSFMSGLAAEVPADTQAFIGLAAAVGGDLASALSDLGPQVVPDIEAITQLVTEVSGPLDFALTVGGAAVRDLISVFGMLIAPVNTVTGAIARASGFISFLGNVGEGLASSLASPVGMVGFLGTKLHDVVDPAHAASTAQSRVAATSLAAGSASSAAASATSRFTADMEVAGDASQSLATRVSDLTAALNSESSATDTGGAAIVSFHQGLATLQADMTASGNKAGYLTKASQATAAQLFALDGQAKAAAEGLLQTGATADRAAGPLESLRAEMEKIQDPTAAERQLLHELNAEISALRSRDIEIRLNVDETSSGTVLQAPPGAVPRIHAASGAVVPGLDTGRDTVHAMVRPYESIMVPEFTRAHGPDQIMRWNREYASGRRGPVTASFADGGVVSASASGDTFNVFVSLLGINDVASGGPSAADTVAREFEHARTISAIRDAERTALEDLSKYYTGPHAGELGKIIRDQTGVLTGMARTQDKLNTTIAGMRSYSQQEIQSLQQFSSLSGITVPQSASGTAEPTAHGIAAGLHKDLGTLKKFYGLLGRLHHAGVAKALIAQVEQMDPESGITYAEAILSGGSGLIHEIDRYEHQIGVTETDIGHRAADIQYGQSISKGFLTGLEHDRAALAKRMRELGDEIARELLRALHGNEHIADHAAVSGTVAAQIGALSVPGSAGALTHSDVQQIRASLAGIERTEQTETITRKQADTIITLLRSAPRQTGAAAGAAFADGISDATRAGASRGRRRVTARND